MTPTPHVVILGGGFGGLRVALTLARRARRGECTITLVDRDDTHVYKAVLYEVATAFNPYEREAVGTVLRETASVPLTRILEGSDVVFLERTVDRIDPGSLEVHFTNGESLVAETLVLALGSHAATFGIPGVEANAFSIRTLPEAMELRHHLVRQFLKYRAASRKRQERAFRVVIVGGGASGVELAGELVFFFRKLARLHGVDRDLPRVVLLEASDVLLREFPEYLRVRALARLRALGVEVRVRHAACEVGSEYLACTGEISIPADTIVWLAGNRAHEVLGRSGLPVHPRGGVSVEWTLQVPRYPEIFAVGDCVYAHDPATGRIVPDVAYAAIRQGGVVAENILRRIRGRPLISFIDRPRPILATIGGKFAVVSLPPFQFAGWIGWLLKVLFDLHYLFSILPNDVAFRRWFRSVRVRVAND